MTTYRLMDGVAGRPGVGSSGTQPPASPTAYSGNYIAGLVFKSTGTVWFQGYWWYVPAGGDTGAVKCALWQAGGPGSAFSQGTVVPGSVVTSGVLTAGQWNFVTLPTPLQLTNDGTFYIAAVGFHTTIGFPDTTHQFGAGEPYASGITNGPITAPQNGALAGLVQMPFSTAGADPSLILPVSNDLNDNLWLDVQVTDTPPTGATYRLWPNLPYAIGDGTGGGVSSVTDGYNIGPQFRLSQRCTLTRIWFYSASNAFGGAAAAALPTRVAIWDVATHTVVSGTDNAAISWKKPDGTAGSVAQGWLYCDYSGAGIMLNANQDYKATAWYAGGSTWRTVVDTYWASPGLGANGITMGPLFAPNNAGASVAQESWSGPNLAFAYPGSASFPENDWIDLEVLPVSDVSGAVASVSVAAPSGAPAITVTGIAGPVTVVAATGTAGSTAPPSGASVDARATMQFQAYTSVTASATMEFEAGQPVNGDGSSLASDPWTSMYPG